MVPKKRMDPWEIKPASIAVVAGAVDDVGKVGGERIYLVTDNRSQRVNALVSKLIRAMGEDDKDWVVRVLDTNPQSANAFVYGGKYIYVYTGLIKEASSDDELAVVLGHELGHSLTRLPARGAKPFGSGVPRLPKWAPGCSLIRHPILGHISIPGLRVESSSRKPSGSGVQQRRGMPSCSMVWRKVTRFSIINAG